MLERVLEPEVMDTEEDAAEYTAIDNADVNREFVTYALALAPPAGSVLDVGTGPGDIAVLLAQSAPELRVLAVDLSENMLAMARKTMEKAGLGDRLRVARADAKATGEASASFDMILSNSLVHHIPDPALFFAEIKRLARPGAALFVKDLHRPDDDGEHRHLVDTYASDCTPYQRRLFSDSLRAALTVDEVRAICERLEFSDVRVRRCSDRHWCLERPASAPA